MDITFMRHSSAFLNSYNDILSRLGLSRPPPPPPPPSFTDRHQTSLILLFLSCCCTIGLLGPRALRLGALIRRRTLLEVIIASICTTSLIQRGVSKHLQARLRQIFSFSKGANDPNSGQLQRYPYGGPAKPRVVFAFGPNDGYFLRVDDRMAWHNIPSELIALISGYDPRVPSKAKTVHWLALGPGREEFCVAWTTEDHVGWSYRSPKSSLRDFYTWQTSPTARYIYHTTRLAIGPAGRSWWASAKGGSSVLPRRGAKWSGLSRELDGILHSRDRLRTTKGRVSQVVLGRGGDYILIFKGGEVAWKLRSYPSLEEILDNRDSGSSALLHVSLSSSQSDNFFVVFADGKVHWKVPVGWVGMNSAKIIHPDLFQVAKGSVCLRELKPVVENSFQAVKQNLPMIKSAVGITAEVVSLGMTIGGGGGCVMM